MHRVDRRPPQPHGVATRSLALFLTVLAVVSVGLPLANAGTHATAGSSSAPPAPGAHVAPIASSSPLPGPRASPHATRIPASLVVSPTSGPVGTVVSFVATHYAITSTFKITLGSTTVCSGTTNSKGNFSCTYAIPNMGGGVKSFVGTDSKSNTAPASFTLLTSLTANPASGLVGTTVVFHGAAFGGQSGSSPTFYPVEITWAGGTVCQTNTSGLGEFNCTFQIPAVGAGPKTFSGISLNVSLTATAVFVVTPGLSVGPSYGPVGTRLTFTGTGFGASDSLAVTWSAGTACTALVSGSGGFSCAFVVPAGTAGGPYVFTGLDSGANSATTSFVVTYLRAAPVGGPVGSLVNFSAGGFTPSTAIAVTWGNGTVCSGGTTTTNGTYSCSFALPATTAGQHAFYANDSAGLSASTEFTVQPALTLSPDYGAAGRLVTFNGSGFGAALAVGVTGPGGPACSATSSATGSFTCTYTIPSSTPGGAVPFTAEDSALDAATATYYVTNLTVIPNVGPVGTAANLTGAGYKPLAPYTVAWGASTVCSGTTTATGSFRCAAPIHVPWATAGLHVLTATDGSAGDSATATFTVTPSLSVNKSSGVVGGSFAFSASGFAATAVVSVTWSGGTACSATTSAVGAMNCTFVLPPAANGPYVFSAADPSSDLATTTITVGAYLSLSPTTGPVGTSVSITATGFSAAVPISVSSALGTACSGSTSSSGSFACVYAVPPTPAGAYTLTATDTNSHRASARFTLVAALTENRPSGTVGTLVTFSGTGFVAGRPVNVSWAGGVACTGISSTVGSFSCLFAVPTVAGAIYPFTARDAPAGLDVATVSFTVLPSLVAAPAAGPVGTVVTFQGAGYPATTLINITWSAGTACAVRSGATGAFSCGYTIPATSAGAHSFTGAAATGPSAQTTFTVAPFLVPMPASGPVGTEITFNGSGFAGGAAVSVTWSGGLGCTATTSGAGSFNCSMTMPPSPYGPTEFTATDGYTASANFTVVSQLTSNPTSGLDGTPVTFSGTGFSAAVTVTLTWGGGTVCSLTSSASGSFSCPFTIPVGTPGGIYPFTATDANGHSAITSVTVTTKLTVGPGRGDVPILVTFNGSGFAASRTVNVTWTYGTACSLTTTAAGTFTCTYTLPGSTPGGNYTFSAADTALNSASAKFVVTYLTVTPTGAIAGSTVHFAAGGFAPNSSFAIRWTNGVACSGTTTAADAFACGFVIPSGTAPGSYTFTGKDAAGTTAVAAFSVFGIPTITSVLPNRTGVDIGQTVHFTATASGGSGVYSTYTWYVSSANLGCSVASTPTISCTPSTVGHYTVAAIVTDSDGVSSTNVSSPGFAVSPDPTVNPPTANVTAADVGQAVTFSVVAGAGNGTLLYAWNGLPNGCAGSSASFACTPSATVSDARISVTVTDANGYAVTSTALSFNVTSDPTVSAPGANRSSVDVGQSVTFSVTGSGGAGTLSFIWSGLPSGCAGTASVVSCAPTAPVVNTPITATVVDANGFHTTSSALSFTVYSDPVPTTPVATPGSIDLGQSVQFSTSATGGYGTLHFAWSGLPAGCGGSVAVISCAPTLADVGAAITVTVTDANGFAVTSAALAFSVYPDPTVTMPTASAPAADVGQTVTFTAPVSGGSGQFTFVWSALPTGCTGTTQVVVCAALSTAGTFDVSFKVTDSNGFSATAGALPFVVSADPTVSTPTANVSSADVGQSVNFSVTVTDGAGGLTFLWSGLPAGCAGTGAFVDCAPTTPVAGASITVSVTDRNGYTVLSDSLLFTVYTDPTVSTPTAVPASADVGQSVTFTTTLSGGAGSPTYTWSGLPTGCTPAGTSVTCTSLPSAATLSIGVQVKDANGFVNASANLTFTVLSDPSATAVSASPATVDVGQTISFATTASGGAGGFRYSWSGLPTGCSGTSDPLVCVPTAAGASTVSVTVTDANGATYTPTTVAVTVYADPHVTLGASPSTFLLGKSVAFHGTVTDGSGGFTYTWSGLPAGCAAGASATVSCTPTASGTFQVELTVKDSNGKSASSNTTVTVSPSFLGMPAVEGEAIVGGGIAAAAIAGLLVLLVVRRRRRPTGAAPVPWSPSPGTPPAPPTPAPPAEPAWNPPPVAPSPAGAEEPPPWEMPSPETEAPSATDEAGPSALPAEDHST